jgi:hypothetical protein
LSFLIVDRYLRGLLSEDAAVCSASASGLGSLVCNVRESEFIVVPAQSTSGGDLKNNCTMSPFLVRNIYITACNKRLT